MSLSKNKNKYLTVVNNNQLYIITFNYHSNLEVLNEITLDQLLGESHEFRRILKDMKNRVNSLLIVPDYWVGNNFYKLQSRKASIADAFIVRKLQDEYPDLPDIKYFFEKDLYQTEESERWLYVCFFNEPRFYELYENFSQFDFPPHRITSPAFLWERKLKKNISDFDKGGKGFIHISEKECHLYFFSRGHFLFSRSIELAASQAELADIFTLLTFEIEQSLRLISQKTRAGIDDIYISSLRERDAQALSDMLGRPIKELQSLLNESTNYINMVEQIGPAGFFEPIDFVASKNQLSFSHKVLRKEMEWKPIQKTGIAIGLLLVILLCTEAFFIRGWSKSNPFLNTNNRMTDIRQQETINEYNQAIDSLLREMERISPVQIIVRIIKSLPENISIKEINIDLETNPGLDFTGLVTASGPEQFKEFLSVLLTGLGENFKPRLPLTLKDINFEIENTLPESSKTVYFIKFRLDL